MGEGIYCVIFANLLIVLGGFIWMYRKYKDKISGDGDVLSIVMCIDKIFEDSDILTVVMFIAICLSLSMFWFFIGAEIDNRVENLGYYIVQILKW